MGVEAAFSVEAFNAVMESVPEICGEEIIRTLSYLGEQCIRRIRDRSAAESWIDQTGNLRSSIGYAVYEEGIAVMESAFDQVKNGGEGSIAGRKLIAELASKYAETYALVVVAGMEYADYVEAKSNKDVLASTQLWARKEIDQYLDKAKKRIVSRIEKSLQSIGL